VSSTGLMRFRSKPHDAKTATPNYSLALSEVNPMSEKWGYRK
jgi:hypothetical protein